MCTHAHSTTHEPAGDVVRPGTRHDAARAAGPRSTTTGLLAPWPQHCGRSTVAAAPPHRERAPTRWRPETQWWRGRRGGTAATAVATAAAAAVLALRWDDTGGGAGDGGGSSAALGSGRQGHDLHNSNMHRHHNQRCSYGRSGAFETVQSYFVEEVVVGRKAHDNHATTKTDSCRRSTSVRPLEHDVVQSAGSNSGSLRSVAVSPHRSLRPKGSEGPGTQKSEIIIREVLYNFINPIAIGAPPRS